MLIERDSWTGKFALLIFVQTNKGWLVGLRQDGLGLELPYELSWFFDIIFLFHIPFLTVYFLSFSTFVFSCKRRWQLIFLKWPGSLTRCRLLPYLAFSRATSGGIGGIGLSYLLVNIRKVPNFMEKGLIVPIYGSHLSSEM